MSGNRHRFAWRHQQGILTQIVGGLTAGHGEVKKAMIDATYLKEHRTESSLRVKKGGVVA